MGLKHTLGKVVVRVDTDQKNFHTFSNGQTIRLERDWDNFDRSYTQQVFGECVSGREIPSGSLVLFHFNCIHPTYEIKNYAKISGSDIASQVRYFSIPAEQVYLWKMPNDKEWQPCNGFAIALRVFEPYKGILQGIDPKKLKDTLYVKTGEFQGLVVRTLKACDAELIFRNEIGVEERIIRFRPNGDEKTGREAEAVAIDNTLTKRVKKGELLVGVKLFDAKPITENVPVI